MELTSPDKHQKYAYVWNNSHGKQLETGRRRGVPGYAWGMAVATIVNIYSGGAENQHDLVPTPGQATS